jgi:nitrite reductase (cytochrome c-552)
MHMKKFIGLLTVFILTFSLMSCRRVPEEPPAPPAEEEPTETIPAPEDMIIDPAAWQDEYPMIYESFMRTARMGDYEVEDPGLGGLHPIDYLKKYPNITILYEGMGFAKEYFEARGHFYALEDVINIARPKPGASCLACKTGEYERLFVEQGDALFAKDFDEVVQNVQFAITCYNCHRNNPEAGVQTSSPHFNEAVGRLNMDLKAGTKACAQCHIEYYIDANSKEIVLPWDKGLGIDEIEAYFDEINHTDWVHPRTGTSMLKLQHPEFELYTGSVHDQYGITCADCHMPTVTENDETYKSHWAKSPLKTVNESCGKCHRAQIDQMVEIVENMQMEVEQDQVEVSDMLVKLTVDLGEAIEQEKLDEETLNRLRSLHRKAQYRWDFIFVENSTGFHNFKKSTDALNDAKAYAQEALDILEGLN